jgi:hypothetical protein
MEPIWKIRSSDTRVNTYAVQWLGLLRLKFDIYIHCQPEDHDCNSYKEI